MAEFQSEKELKDAIQECIKRGWLKVVGQDENGEELLCLTVAGAIQSVRKQQEAGHAGAA